MKVAIHHREGSFSEFWIEYCIEYCIPFKIVDCYDSSIVEKLKDCKVLMWHHHHGNYRDVLFAKGLLFSLEQTGIKVFPDFNTSWHFDDKIGQKYLLEAIGAPIVPSYVFYDKKKAMEWAGSTTYPKVFKLRGGAGATNVKLVHNFKNCKKIIDKAFGKGFSQYDALYGFRDILNKYKNGKATIKNVIGGLLRIFKPKEFERMAGREKGYVYFQDFIPNNSYDTRVVVVDGNASAERRFVRKNDFRASGSGEFSYDNINLNCIEVAFDIAQKLKLQSVAFDFVENEKNEPLIIEISYGFGIKGITNAPGYWNSSMERFKENFNPQKKMIEAMLQTIKEENIENL